MIDAGRHSIVPDYICKIEGHGVLNIQFHEKRARLEVSEGERLFEGFMLGRKYIDAPFITSRICGVCPTVHCLTSICALERALDIEVSTETEMLRKVLLAAQMLQSHALHMFFLALPDYLDVDDAVEIARKFPDEFHIALNLKHFGDKVVEVIGGRAVHPMTPQVSGFDALPTKDELQGLLEEAEGLMGDAEKSIALFDGLEYPVLIRPTQYLAARKKGEFAVYDASVIGSNITKDFEVMQYDKHIKEIVKDYSTAKFSTKEQRGFMVGSQARIDINRDHLFPGAKRALLETDSESLTNNPYYNNLAQAIEILHFLEETVVLLKELLTTDLENARPFDYEIGAGYGVGACEAPRGTLYHAYRLDNEGIITYCNIITPTAQNLTNIEEDAKKLLEENKTDSHEKQIKLLDMLIRAYDPCISCSVH